MFTCVKAFESVACVADKKLICHFIDEIIDNFIQLSSNFITQVLIDSPLTLVQVLAWGRTDLEPLP